MPAVHRPVRPRLRGQALGLYQPRVITAKADRAHPGLLNMPHQRRVHLPDKHHLHHIQSRLIGDPKPVNKARLKPQPVQQLANLRPAAMHDDRSDAGIKQCQQILSQRPLQPRIIQHPPAAFNHHTLVAEAGKGRSGHGGCGGGGRV